MCVFRSVYVCHDLSPEDLTIKDWCHTNNILQVHCWWCLVVQVMFHAHMTSIFGLSRWNKKWNVRNSYTNIATATKIWFNFQFPRSPDATFGRLMGWLVNWKCKFSCRILSNIANYFKNNYFWDGNGIDHVTLRHRKFSDFYSRHTVGVAGDDIMFHILVFQCCRSFDHTLNKMHHDSLWRNKSYLPCIYDVNHALNKISHGGQATINENIYFIFDSATLFTNLNGNIS